MRKLEYLIDALEQDGHSEIREKINERREVVKRESSLQKILTQKEIFLVEKTLEAFKPPAPTGWAHALMIHLTKKNIKEFSPDRPYDYTELGNLTTTLNLAGLANQEILHKLIKSGDAMKRYENGVEQL
jgi:hypothetical protein